MVSLFEILSQSSAFSHLSTSIPTLDSLLLSNVSSGIYDFQTVPSCTAPYSIIVSVIISHLRKSEYSKVVIIDCLHPFPFKLLEDHPQFELEWYDKNLISYSTDTFGKLFALFMSNKLEGMKGTAIIIINNFHELVDLYRLELAAAYRESLLKFQILRNSILINHKEKSKTEGVRPTLPELPPQSDLLRINPAQKFQAHLSSLVNMISQFTYKNDSLCILIGCLDIKYEGYKSKQFTSQDVSQRSSSASPAPSSSSSRSPSVSVVEQGHLKLAPSLGGKYASSSSITGNQSNNKSSLGSSLDSFITVRVLFYKDWYHNTSHFKEKYFNSNVRQKIVIKPFQLRTIYSAKIISLQVPGSLCPVVHFDYDNEFYDNIDANKHTPKFEYVHFIDLTGSQVPITTSNHQISSFSEEHRSGSEDEISAFAESAPRKRVLPSSPNLTASQITDLLLTTANSDYLQPNEDEISIIHAREGSVVEASDEEMMGTPLLSKSNN